MARQRVHVHQSVHASQLVVRGTKNYRLEPSGLV